MQTQFQYIIDLAKLYKSYSDNPNLLYNAINELSKESLEDIYKEYGDPDKEFKPVVLLRAEIARQLLEEKIITPEIVEDLKEKIRTKDLNFFSHLNKSFLEELIQYPIPHKRDVFANWQKPWNIFYTFFYRKTIKETVQIYLEQISEDLILKLGLEDYTYHHVDFQGATNFGSDRCWIALYPLSKDSHKEGYQFFVSLSSTPEAGRFAGDSISNPSPNFLKSITNYDVTLNYLNTIKPEIINLNNEIRNYFKFAPGSQASEWEQFYSNEIAAIDYNSLNLGDLNNYDTAEQIKSKIGLAIDDKSTQVWNLWLFKTANIGDLVFASKGANTCIGIGIIDGNYYYEESKDGYNHKRKVKWITNKIYQYQSNTIKGTKNLFRVDTFSPTRVWDFILREYSRLYPELINIFKKNGIHYSFENPDNKDNIFVKEPRPDPPEQEEVNFWWLNANPKIWQMSSFEVGQRQKYTTHNEKGNKRRVYKYFESVKPGDLMIGYESSSSNHISLSNGSISKLKISFNHFFSSSTFFR